MVSHSYVFADSDTLPRRTDRPRKVAGVEGVTHLSLFSGIGGIDVAAHWAGFETIQFVEKEPFCQKVLAKNFPGVPIHDDIKTFDAKPFRGCTLVSGGFPCQDVSHAGKQRGLSGERSGLFFEMARVIQEVAPRFAIIENTSGLRTRGLASVIGELALCGYESAWFIYSARGVGAPHLRRRCFLVAYPYSNDGEAWMGHLPEWQKEDECPYGVFHSLGIWNEPYSGVYGMGNGVPKGLDVDRIRALGNAVVPQQVYPILKAIADYEREAI